MAGFYDPRNQPPKKYLMNDKGYIELLPQRCTNNDLSLPKSRGWITRLVICSSPVALILGLIFMLGTTVTAAAASETFTDSISSTQVGFTKPLTLEAFDTNLGTLTGINLRLQLDTSSSVEIFDTSPIAQTFSNASTESSVTLEGPGNLALISQPLGAIVASGVADSGLNIEPATIGSFNISVTPTDLSAFEVNGLQDLNFTVSASDETSAGTSLSDDLFFGGLNNLDATVTLQYTFAVPEPSTWATVLVGLALLILGRMRMRLKRI
jgi:hypothetical protein